MSGWLDRIRFRRDHRWAPGQMSGYLDGDLDPARRVRLEHHLGECARCRRLLASLRRILDGLHRLSEAEATVDVMMQTIHAHPTLYEAVGEAFNAVYGLSINA